MTLWEGPNITSDKARYKIRIDGTWILDELAVLSRTYNQVFSLIYSIDHTPTDSTNEIWTDDTDDLEYENRPYAVFPWRGGYSAVNFYNTLYNRIPRTDRPQILSMQYASPGWIELQLPDGMAVTIAALIAAVAYAASTYTRICNDLRERRLLRLEEQRRELELTARELELIHQHLHVLSEMLGFGTVEQLNSRTGDPLVSLKILLSLFRRLRQLFEYEVQDKAKF